MFRSTPIITSRLPPGIPFIIGNEVAERFSFYGMRSVLLAYMTLYLTQPDGELAVFGAKSAEAWVHLFVGSAYFFPIIGGLIADAFWGNIKPLSFYRFVTVQVMLVWLLWGFGVIPSYGFYSVFC